MKITEIKSVAFSDELIDVWTSAGIIQLTDIQTKAFSHASIVTGVKNAIVVGPTSSGKTFVGEALGVARALKLERVIYLVPYKALAAEKYLTLRKLYGEVLGGIVVSSGDYSEFDPDIRRGNFSVAVMVYEKFAHLLLAHPGLLRSIGLLVVDEIQMIRDPYRGARLELVLTKILLAEQRPQILALSATVRELRGFDEWLDADVIASSVRPVPLLEGVCDLKGYFEYIDDNGARKGESLGLSRVCLDGDDLLAALVAHHCGKGRQILIFRNSKPKTVATARRIKGKFEAKNLAPAVVEQLSLLDETDVRAYLEDGLCRGVAYHNADLSLEERALIEQAFREGRISVLVSTTTLAAGVNLPADVVILPDVTRWNPTTSAEEPISVTEYKNMAGRAGRLSLGSEGRSILLATGGPYTSGALIASYVEHEVEPMESAIPKDRDFPHLVLSLIASGLARTEDEVSMVLKRSFAFISFYSSRGGLGDSPRGAVKRLVDLDLVKLEDGQLSPSNYGKVVAASGLSTESFGVLKHYLDVTDPGRFGFPELIYVVCGLKEVVGLPPYLARDEKIGTKFIRVLPRPEEIAKGSRLRRVLEAGSPPGPAENSPLQKVVLLDAWRSGESARNLGRVFRIGLGAVRDLGEKVGWVLDALEACAKIEGYPEDFRRELRAVAEEVHFGVPRSVVKFAELRAQGVSRDQILRLAKNDKGVTFESCDDLLEAPVEAFKGVVSAAVVQRLKEAILQQSGESLRRAEQGQMHRLEQHGLSTVQLQAAYARKGTDLEIALEDIFKAAPFNWACVRIARQHQAEADLHLTATHDDLIVIQVTASDDGKKPIGWVKTKEVLGSAPGLHPVSYVVVGRPDFHELAQRQAEMLKAEPERPLLLIPLPVLMEAYVRLREGRTQPDALLSLLRTARGYLSFERLGEILGA